MTVLLESRVASTGIAATAIPATITTRGPRTLGTVIGEAWEGLHRSGSARCPVCDGQLLRVGSGGALVARCGGCGSELS